MRFLLSTLAEAVDGRLVGPDLTITEVSTDSRTAGPGQLFVPLVAERDGHDFIADAVASGAPAYLTARPDQRPGPDDERASAIIVSDTAAALTAIGRTARARLNGPVVGITGSVGKTSVKDLTTAACSGSAVAWASAASYNNEIGVPLTLANAPDDTEVAIVEMGSRGIGHIAELCEVARPTIGLVTSVALVHSELFGSIETVAAAKGELIQSLPTDGTAVLNADDPLVAAMAARTAASIVTFGTGPADIRVGAVSVDSLLRPTFTISSDRDEAELTLEVSGAHMAINAAAAVGAAVAAGIPFPVAVDGLRTATLSPWRMDVAEAPSGLIVVNDAYNANPTSMRAAVRSLVELPVAERVAVVGVMAELGEEGPAEHLAIAAEAAAAGIRLIAVDAKIYGDDAEHVSGRDEALELLDGLGPGAAVLVKGSRVAGLEAVAEDLLART